MKKIQPGDVDGKDTGSHIGVIKFFNEEIYKIEGLINV